jgi:hypothetical protein
MKRRRTLEEIYDNWTLADTYPTANGRTQIISVTEKMQTLLIEEEHIDPLAARIARAARAAYADAHRGLCRCLVCSEPVAQDDPAPLPMVAWSDATPMMRGVVCARCRHERTRSIDPAAHESLLRHLATRRAADRGAVAHDAPGHA